MSSLKNELSWSFSRHHCFQTCLKQYYFSYYGAWGGWEREADARTRLLYQLKKLTTRAQWAGTHVHAAIEHLLQTARGTLEHTAGSGLEDTELNKMRQEFAASRAGAYRQNPSRIIGLFEHEYELPVPAEEWKAMADRVAESIRGFLAAPLWASLREMPDEAFLAIEKRSFFDLDGLKVWAIPDLAIRQDNRIHLYDWKTGTAPLSTHRTQLAVYALLAMDKWTANPEDIRATAYRPVDGESETFCYQADELENLRDFIRDSADEMLFPLEDPEHNRAGNGETFECTTDPLPCRSCSFLRVCPRWTA